MPLQIKLIISFILLSLLQNAQTYNFKNYNTEQGLPQSQVLCITQDSKGNMWFGTNSGGAGKFDGNKFTTYSDNDGLINNVVFSITETKDNKIVFGTNRGISVYNGFYFKNYGEKDGLKNPRVFKVLDDHGVIWIGTEEGVYQLQDNKILPFTLDNTLNKSSVFSIYVDSKKRIWFATFQNGAICFNPSNNSFKHFTTKNGLKENFIFSITETNDGDILIGTVSGLNIINSENQVTEGKYIKSQENIGFRSIVVDSKNDHWYGTASEGVYRYTNQKLIKYNSENGLTNKSILSIYQDREKNLWIGTDGDGVYKYSGARFTSFSKANNLPENYINSIAQDKNGHIWVSSRNMGVTKLEGSQVTNYTVDAKKPNALPDNNITTMISSKFGDIWLGTNDGLCHYNGQSFNTISDNNFRHKYILSLHEDKKGSIWIGTTNGLFKYSNNFIVDIKLNHNENQETGQFLILSIGEDKNGHIWVGTENGAIEYDGSTSISHNDSSGFINKRIMCISSDYKGNLWFGTEDGVYNYDYKKFNKISQKNGLSSNFINLIITDQNKNLFIGTNNGLDKLDLNAFYSEKITIKHYGKEDGLVSLECNSNACIKDNMGRIWIGTINGVEIYNPNEDFFNAQEPLTHINQIKLFFNAEEFKKQVKETDSISKLPVNLILPYNKNHLTFEYVGVCHVNPEKVRYLYKLDGIDNDWSPPTSKTEITYPSLPPGKYTFMVKAMNNDGVWNYEPTTFSFEILPPWYKTWWFYSICIIVIISGAWYYNHYKTKKLIEDKAKLEKEVSLRTKELREEKEKVEIINKEVIEQKAIIEHKNTEITDSIKYAKNIQEALLPSLKSIYESYKDIFILYMPKDIVSGDFYWFAQKNNIRFIAAVDCTGHGVPGAFMSIVGNTLLNEIVNDKNITNPGDILLELHKGVKIALNQSNQEFERRDGMDIALCAIEENSNIVHYSGANRPLWIFRNGNNEAPEIIKPNKFPIGGMELDQTRIYESHSIEVKPGDCIYMFSDGYADQFGGPKGKKFMVSNMQKVISAMVHLPVNQQKQTLYDAFVDWKQNNEQVDDVLVIGLRI